MGATASPGVSQQHARHKAEVGRSKRRRRRWGTRSNVPLVDREFRAAAAFDEVDNVTDEIGCEHRERPQLELADHGVRQRSVRRTARG